MVWWLRREIMDTSPYNLLDICWDYVRSYSKEATEFKDMTLCWVLRRISFLQNIALVSDGRFSWGHYNLCSDIGSFLIMDIVINDYLRKTGASHYLLVRISEWEDRQEW